MTTYIFSGNYIEALKAQNLSVKDFTAQVDPETNLEQVNKDLIRLSLLGYSDESPKFNKFWRESEDHSYSQGNMDARVFQNTNFKARCLGVVDSGDLMNLPLETLLTVKVKEFAVSYINNDGHLSGFSVVYNVLNPTQWEVAIIRKANLAPESREVFLMSHLDQQEPYQIHLGDPNQRMSSEFHSDDMGRFFQDVIGANGQVHPGILNIAEAFVEKRDEKIDGAQILNPIRWINARQLALQNMTAKLNVQNIAPKNVDILTPELHANLTQKVDKIRRKARQLEKKQHHDAANELKIIATEIEHHLEIAFTLDTFPELRNSDLQRAELQMIQTTINNVSSEVKQLPGVLGLLKQFVDFVYKKTGMGKRLVRFFKDIREKELDDVSQSILKVIEPVAAA